MIMTSTRTTALPPTNLHGLKKALVCTGKPVHYDTLSPDIDDNKDKDDMDDDDEDDDNEDNDKDEDGE